jgi:hypothetical protein
MDRYEQDSYIEYLLEEFIKLRKDSFTVFDIATLQDKLHKIYFFKKRRLRRIKRGYYHPVKIGEDMIEWISGRADIMKLADKYYGWISSKRFRELYNEYYKLQKTSAQSFIPYITNRWGDEIYRVRTYRNNKSFRGVNLFKILGRKDYEEGSVFKVGTGEKIE